MCVMRWKNRSAEARKEKNVRPTINSYMYGNAEALAKMARLAGNDSLYNRYSKKAAELKSVVTDYLWNDTSTFLKFVTPMDDLRMPGRQLALFPGILTCRMTKHGIRQAMGTT